VLLEQNATGNIEFDGKFARILVIIVPHIISICAAQSQYTGQSVERIYNNMFCLEAKVYKKLLATTNITLFIEFLIWSIHNNKIEF
jgi:hypothetical protein